MVSALHRVADGAEGRICGDKKLFWTNMSCLPTLGASWNPTTYEDRAKCPECWVAKLRDHVIMDKPLMPGAAFVDINASHDM